MPSVPLSCDEFKSLVWSRAALNRLTVGFGDIISLGVEDHAPFTGLTDVDTNKKFRMSLTQLLNRDLPDEEIPLNMWPSRVARTINRHLEHVNRLSIHAIAPLS